MLDITEYNGLEETVCLKRISSNVLLHRKMITVVFMEVGIIEILEFGLHGTVIRNNIVLDCDGPIYGYVTPSNRRFGQGIYIDEQAKDVTIENNIVANMSDACIRLHQNEGGLVRNNIVFGSRAAIPID